MPFLGMASDGTFVGEAFKIHRYELADTIAFPT